MKSAGPSPAPGVKNALWRLGLTALLAACTFSACTSRYPFMMMAGDRPSKTETVVDRVHHVAYRFEATYTVGDRVASRIILVISNNSGHALSLANGRIKITSLNIDYEMNGRFIPLPDLVVAPHRNTTLTFTGTGRRPVDEPWQGIAGERMTVELRGLSLGGEEIPAQTVRFIPVNPKL